MSNVIVVLTETTGRELRLSLDSIGGYGVHIPIFSDSPEPYTALYSKLPELPVVFVKETPKDIDRILTECYMMIKNGK